MVKISFSDSQRQALIISQQPKYIEPKLSTQPEIKKSLRRSDSVKQGSERMKVRKVTKKPHSILKLIILTG